MYLFAFLGGVIVVNIFGSHLWESQNVLNRYSLASLSFRGIVYEDYFFQVLFLRLKTVLVIWLGTKFLPKSIVANSFAGIVCAILGSVLAMSILENGVWGVWFFISALVPHIIFYIMAFVLYRNGQEIYYTNINRSETNMKKMLILVLIVIGCICESFISPVVIENIIKY